MGYPGATSGASGWTHPRSQASLHVAEKVARFLAGISPEEKMGRALRYVSKESMSGGKVHAAQINGGPAIVTTSRDRPVSAPVLDVAEGLIETIYLVANLNKLAGLRKTRAYPPPGRPKSLPWPCHTRAGRLRLRGVTA